MTQKEKLEALKKQTKIVEAHLLQRDIWMKQMDTVLKNLEVIKCDKTIEPATVKRLIRSHLVVEKRFSSSLIKELMALMLKEKSVQEGKV